MGTVPSTSVTMTAIQTEFGGDGAISLSEYYRGTSTFSGSSKFVRPEVSVIPLTGAISIGDFRGQENSPPNNPKIMRVGEAEFKGTVTRRGYFRAASSLFTEHGSLANRYMPIGTSVWPGFNSTISQIAQGQNNVFTFELAADANNTTWSTITIGPHTVNKNSMTYSVTAGNAQWTLNTSSGFLFDYSNGTSVTVSFT